MCGMMDNSRTPVDRELKWHVYPVQSISETYSHVFISSVCLLKIPLLTELPLHKKRRVWKDSETFPNVTAAERALGSLMYHTGLPILPQAQQQTHASCCSAMVALRFHVQDSNEAPKSAVSRRPTPEKR